MTNKEAIETLKANYPDACFEQLREAVDMAIKTLKAQDAPDKKSELKPCGLKIELVSDDYKNLSNAVVNTWNSRA